MLWTAGLNVNGRPQNCREGGLFSSYMFILIISESRACPVSRRPAPGPISVTSPRLSVFTVIAFTAPPTWAKGCDAYISRGMTYGWIPNVSKSMPAINFITLPFLEADAICCGVI